MVYTVNLGIHLEIASVPMSTPAWEHTNLYVLLGQGKVRGENVVMPGALGRRAVGRRTDEMTETIDLAFFGDVDWTGAPQTDPVAGLFANLAEFKAKVVDPTLTADSTRPATLVLPDGNLSAQVQVLGFEISESYNASSVSASMDIAILGGAFR
jgi:hypothetical protein